MKNDFEAYEVWRVPNGCWNDFCSGIMSGCKWIGDGFEFLKDAEILRDECSQDDSKYASSHHIIKTFRDIDYNLLSSNIVY